MPSPLAYASAPTPERSDGQPRLSKLAVFALVVSFFTLVQSCGCPLAWWVQRFVPPHLHRYVIVGVPVSSFLLSCVALGRILCAMDKLRGEGLAITGIIVSFLMSVLMIVATV